MSKKGDTFYSYIYVIPAVLLFSLFFMWPTLQGVMKSFTYWNATSARFAGFDNYLSIIADSKMNIVLKNTFIFTVVTTLFKMFFGMILALLLNRRAASTKIIRSVYFMPAIISNISVALIFNSIHHPLGIMNGLLKGLHLNFLAMNWLTDTKLVMYSISAIEVWKWSGFTMTMLLAGLQTIPAEYYEAANLDGASALQKFRHIQLPLIMPAFNNALIFSLIGGIKVFDIVYALTGGDPGSASEVLNSYVFKAYANGFYGEACAAGTIIGLFVLVITLLMLNPLRKKEVEL